MLTALMLLSLYKSPVVPLAEVCERYLAMSLEEASRLALRNELPLPVFRLSKSRTAPFMVSVEALAIWLDTQAAAATEQWQQAQVSPPLRQNVSPHEARAARPDSLMRALVEVSRGTDTTVMLAPARRVRPALAAAITGLTTKAIERKIRAGKWLEGREYFRDSDGRLWVDIEGVMRWVAKGPQQSR